MPTPFRSAVFTGGAFSASGSNGHPSAGLLIYSASRTNAGSVHASDLTGVGSDVFLFVSGTRGSRGTNKAGATVLGGDLIVSGSIYDASGSLILSSSQPVYFTSPMAGIVDTTGSLMVGGSLSATLGLSGSLTRLTSGLSYLVAGANITVQSASNGQVTVTGGSQPAYFTSPLTGVAETTGSLMVGGSLSATLGLSGSLTRLTSGLSYLTAGANITVQSASNGQVTITSAVQGTLGDIYGGGADGAFDLDGTNTYPSYFTKAGSQYTAIVDVKSTAFRVRVGSTLLPSQFWMYAETSFVNEGSIPNNGNSASGGVGGTQKAAAGTLQTIAQSGATGRTTPSNSGAAGNATTNTIGGASGAGGTGGGANLGGLGGVVGAIAATTQGLGTSIFRTSHRLLATSTLTAPGGGCGGGSGGLTLNAGTGTSGGGGGGASAICINARSFNNSGTVSCNGGTGGNASVTVDAVAGGGGGGGGGFISISTDSYANSGTISCLGGLGGTGAGAGAGNGVAGSQGRISVITPTGTTNS
jgi:hypothetical protein